MATQPVSASTVGVGRGAVGVATGGGVIWLDELDGDQSLEAVILGLPDDAHAALAELPDEPVAPDDLACL